MTRLIRTALILLVALGCSESPTQPETPTDDSPTTSETLKLLDDGSGDYLDSFEATHPRATCEPVRIIIYRATEDGPDTVAVVEYECSWVRTD